MKKKVIIAIIAVIPLLMVCSGCNNPRDIGEMLSEQGYEYVSTIKIDSAFVIEGEKESRTYINCCEAEMKVDSLIKSVPSSLTYEQKRKFDNNIMPIAAAVSSLKQEAVNENIDMAYSLNEKELKFVHSGWLAYVKLKVCGKVDEYIACLNKSRSEIIYVEPKKKIDYDYILRYGYFDTYNPYMKY